MASSIDEIVLLSHVDLVDGGLVFCEHSYVWTDWVSF